MGRSNEGTRTQPLLFHYLVFLFLCLCCVLPFTLSPPEAFPPTFPVLSSSSCSASLQNRDARTHLMLLCPAPFCSSPASIPALPAPSSSLPPRGHEPSPSGEQKGTEEEAEEENSDAHVSKVNFTGTQ